MTSAFDQIVTEAAAEMLKAIQKPECLASGAMPTVYAVPTTEDEDGRVVVVGYGFPAPRGGVLVRPNDNHASTHRGWNTVPYTYLSGILREALRIQPILPRPTPKGPHVVSLGEAPHRRAICEQHMVYEVLVNGIPNGDLIRFNMRGYVGYLPLPNGRKMDIGEKGISAFRKEIGIINREAKAAAKL